MKLQVLLRSYGLPILLVITLIVRLTIELTPFRIFWDTFFIIIIVITQLLINRQYLQTLVLNDDRISITYYTRFLQLKKAEFALSEITEVKLSKHSIISLIWPPSLKLKVNDKWMDFKVVTKNLYDEIQQQLASANTALVK